MPMFPVHIILHRTGELPASKAPLGHKTLTARAFHKLQDDSHRSRGENTGFIYELFTTKLVFDRLQRSI